MISCTGIYVDPTEDFLSYLSISMTKNSRPISFMVTLCCGNIHLQKRENGFNGHLNVQAVRIVFCM